jgi:3',5'-cyclic AMP phosphodiesterase CpdA
MAAPGFHVAHFSDLHVLGADEVPFHRYLNKRITGYVNLKYRRKSVHKKQVVQALARELRDRRLDHAVITGDLTNLALEGEFEAVRELLEEDLALSPEHVSIVPGNHDLYTSGSARAKRFARYFEEYLGSDLPGVSTDHPAGPFPYVRLRGPVAFIGVATAVPRPPLFASGAVGRPQLDAIERILAHPEVRSRLPVILQHHPVFNPRSPLRSLMNGLWDARDLRAVLATARHAVVLHGHLHERVHLQKNEGGRRLDSIGATSASLLHEHHHRMAGFNWYELDDIGTFAPPRAFVFHPETGHFHDRDIPLTAHSG